MIAIINACGTNIASIQFAIERLGKKAILTNDPELIRSATHVILPGVGSARFAMERLEEFQLVNLIRSLTQPVLGICLGMQILFEASAEDDVTCLGIIPGRVAPLKSNVSLTIPHMGWNQIEITTSPSPLLKNVDSKSYLYFAHSYALPVGETTTATTNYGEPFSAIVEYRNYVAMQFHPERSSKVGLQLLNNFLAL